MMMGAAWVWTRALWRQRWGSLALAALVLAITVAVGLAAASRTYRAAGAFDRLRAETAATDVSVQTYDSVLADDFDSALRRLFPLIGATAAVREDRFFIRPIGSTLVPLYEMFPVVEHQMLDQPANIPTVVAGRLPDPGTSGEIALGQQMAEEFGLGVGDSVPFESVSQDWWETSSRGGDPGAVDGPTIQLTVTGIVVTPLDFSAPRGAIYLSPAFADQYDTQIAHFPQTNIRVDDPRIAAEMIQIGHPNSGDPQLDSSIAVRPSEWSDLAQVSDGLRLASAALWLFAAVVSVAGLIAFALVMRRLVRSLATDFEALAAIGLDRSGNTTFALLLVAGVVALGVGAGALGALALAPQVGLGFIDRVDPNGDHLRHWWLLAVGLGTMTVLSLALGVGSFGLLRKHTTGSRSVSAGHRPLQRPLTMSLGVRNAFGGRDDGTPSRTTVIAGTLLMTTAVASLVCGASLATLPSHPELWGASPDVSIDFGDGSSELYDEGLAALTQDTRIDALTGVTVFFPELVGVEQIARAIDTRRGTPIVTILEGTAPRGPDEIVMGRASMRRLGLRVGDDVSMMMGEETMTYRLVGQAAFPIGDSAYDDGLAVTIDGARRFSEFAASNHIYLATLSWADGIDGTAATADLVADGYPAHAAPPRPPVVTNLVQTRPVLTLLALFFGLLGLTAVAYVLAVSRKARRRQFAVLTALGMEPRRGVEITGWHAVTLGIIAVVIGVPAGIVAGRVLWATIARRAGVAVEHSLAIGSLTSAVAIAIAGPLAIGLAIAIFPGRLSSAEPLRAD